VLVPIDVPANVDRFVIGFWFADIDKAKPVPSYFGDGFSSLLGDFSLKFSLGHGYSFPTRQQESPEAHSNCASGQ
jgi:hypothetical protein